MRYALLRHPGHNRVYYDASEKMAQGELQLFLQAALGSSTPIDVTTLGGNSYLTFELDSPADSALLQGVSQLSFSFALFQMQGKGNDVQLHPLTMGQPGLIDPKISTLMKYGGKTNERFTRFMINVARFASAYHAHPQPCLLDPVAGKGTTLFEAAVLGMDAYGIEQDSKAVQETSIFFKKFLELEKLKHSRETRPVYKGQQGSGQATDFLYTQEKQGLKSADTRQQLTCIAGNALHTRRYFKADKFHVIVGDLPYGIAHGHKTPKKHRSLTRSPEELLDQTASQWFDVLKPGGAMVLAWNKFVWSREAFTETLEAVGFQVKKTSPFDAFTHRVDQSIKRDIMVAVKP